MISIELKVKNKSLAAEARIIRREEDKLKAWELRHRSRRHDFKSKTVKDDRGVEHTKVSGGWDSKSDELHNKRMQLAAHRRVLVRQERRAAHLAFCFLKGTDYLKVESSAKSRPDWGKIERLAKRYGDQDERVIAQRFAEWKSHAKV